MNPTMRAAVLTAPAVIELETRPVPDPAPDEVLVEVASVGVCGSDVHFYREGRLGDFVADAPLVLGHESGGRVVAVGNDVDPARIGRRVSIEPQHPDPTSRESRAGRYNLDPSIRFFATPPVDGAFAQYVTIQSPFAFDVPDSLSDDAAAMMEPLSVGVAAVQKADLRAGSSVLIAGAGPIGIMCAQVARAHGATRILVSDIDGARRERARAFGATDVLDPARDGLSHDGLSLDVDAFIDASGAPPAIQSGIRAVRPAGRVVLVGMGAQTVDLPLPLIQNRELVLTGVFRYANTWPIAIELAASGRVDLDSMVTAHLGLDRTEEALMLASDPASIKVIVRPQE